MPILVTATGKSPEIKALSQNKIALIEPFCSTKNKGGSAVNNMTASERLFVSFNKM